MNLKIFKTALKNNVIWFLLTVFLVCCFIYASLFVLKDNISFFYERFDHLPVGKQINIGGIVSEIRTNYNPRESDSNNKYDETNKNLEPSKRILMHASKYKEFEVSGRHDTKITVRYAGKFPTLFRLHQGVILKGCLQENGIFIAQKILVKHDEVYKTAK